MPYPYTLSDTTFFPSFLYIAVVCVDCGINPVKSFISICQFVSHRIFVFSYIAFFFSTEKLDEYNSTVNVDHNNVSNVSRKLLV